MMTAVIFVCITVMTYRLSYHLEKKELFQKDIPFFEIFLIALFLVCYENDISQKSAILLSILLAMQYVAQKMDKEYMEVYDLYHYLCFVAIIIFFAVKLFVKKEILHLSGLDLICYLLPLIFSVVTVKTRGFSDTLAMSVYALYGMYQGVGNEIVTIISFYIGYLLQFVMQMKNCKRKGKTYSEGKHEKMPFLPSLYVGFLSGLLLM